MYFHSHRNPNLIAIVPVEEPAPFQQVTYPVEKTEQRVESRAEGRFITLFTKRENAFVLMFTIHVF